MTLRWRRRTPYNAAKRATRESSWRKRSVVLTRTNYWTSLAMLVQPMQQNRKKNEDRNKNCDDVKRLDGQHDSYYQFQVRGIAWNGGGQKMVALIQFSWYGRRLFTCFTFCERSCIAASRHKWSIHVSNFWLNTSKFSMN